MVGAFPQPFLSGYDGKRRPAVVVSSTRARARGRAAPARAASCLRRACAPRTRTPSSSPAAATSDLGARLGSPGSPVRVTFGGDPKTLLRTWPFRYRYEVGG